jgi:predicted AAA+ superfamily ATPase
MNASPVVNLQTNFGGGKTHSMLALWRVLASRAGKVRLLSAADLAADYDPTTDDKTRSIGIADEERCDH